MRKSKYQSNPLLNELLQKIHKNKITEMIKMTVYFSSNFYLEKNKK